MDERVSDFALLGLENWAKSLEKPSVSAWWPEDVDRLRNVIERLSFIEARIWKVRYHEYVMRVDRAERD